MASLRFALAFLSVPRLFVAFVLFPLCISVGVLAAQLFVTGLFITSHRTASASAEKRLERLREESLARRLVYGSGEPRAQILICRWSGTPERPQSDECMPDRLDVAIRALPGQPLPLDEALARFNGYFDRLHICESCHPDVVVDMRNPSALRTDIHSIQGYILFRTTSYHPEVREDMIRVIGRFNEERDFFGEHYFFAPGLHRAISMSALHQQLGFIVSVASLLLIATFLAMKAHRKILEYFSRSGALLPMVASLGRKDFYRSLWLLTAIRVAAFLLAAIPMLIFALRSLHPRNGEGFSVPLDPGETLLWLLALGSSFILATVFSSLSDLRRRKELLSFIYTILPLCISFLGGMLWAISFLLPFPAMGTFRIIITTLPIVGTAPVLIAPISFVGVEILFIHFVASLFFTVWLLKRNAVWFAAHLEEV